MDDNGLFLNAYDNTVANNRSTRNYFENKVAPNFDFNDSENPVQLITSINSDNEEYYIGLLFKFTDYSLLMVIETFRDDSILPVSVDTKSQSYFYGLEVLQNEDLDESSLRTVNDPVNFDWEYAF